MRNSTSSGPRVCSLLGLLLGGCGQAAPGQLPSLGDGELRAAPGADASANPAIPPEDLVLWLDASRPSLVLGGAIDTTGWADLATESRSAEVPDGCSTPLWVESVAALNHRSAVHFDGVSTCLSLPDLYIHAYTTIFIVASASPQTEAGGSWWRPLIAGAGRSFRPDGNAYGIGLGRAGTSGLGVSLGCVQSNNGGVDCQNPGGADAAEQKTFAAGIQQDGRYDVLRVTRNGTGAGGVRVHRGEQLMATGSLRRGTGHGTGYAIGADPAAYGGNAARHYQGDIAEILIYNRVLSDTEVDEVNDYLQHKYNFYQHQLPGRARALWLNASDPRTLHAPGAGGASCREIESLGTQIQDGERVQQWDDANVPDFACRAGGDSSVLGQDAIQNTSSLQPAWMENQANGYPAVVFDGADDLLGMNQLRLGPWASVFIVAQDAEQTTAGGSVWRPLLAHCNDPFRTDGVGYGVALQIHGRGGVAAVLGKSGGLDAVEAPWAAEDGAFHLYALTPGADTNTMQLAVDDGFATTGPRSRSGGFGSCYQLGGHSTVSARRYSGAIAEVLIYDPASEAERLTPGEISNVRRYLTTKYALPSGAAQRWHGYRRQVVQGTAPFPIGAWAFHRTVEKESGIDPYPAYAAAGLTFTQVPADEASFDHLASATANGIRAAVGTWRRPARRFFSHPPGHPDYEDPDGGGEGALNVLAAARDWLGIEDVDPDFYLITDEPERAEFAALGMALRALSSVDTAVPPPVPLLTVVPLSFGSNSRFLTGDRASYSAYIADLIRGTQTGVLAATTYELLGDGPAGPVLPAHYYTTLDVLREQTRRAGIGMFGFVLATGHEVIVDIQRYPATQTYAGPLNRRFDSPNPTQLRRLAYTPLAYGAKGLVYYIWDRKQELEYTYVDDPGRTWYQPGLAEDPELLAAATQINCEVQALGPTLATLDSTNVFHTGADRPADTRAFGELSTSIFAYFWDIGSLVVGEFRAHDALSPSKYAMIVNRDDHNPTTAYFALPDAYGNVTRLTTTNGCELVEQDMGGSWITAISVAPGDSALLRFDP